MAHKHSVRDTGAHYTIDQYTRQIKNDSVNKTTIVQFDHNSERLTFEMPLYVDGHAMTLCDLIEIHYINISTDGNSQNHGTYEVNDIKAEGEKAVFTWLISQECTQLAGSLNFFIVFKCTENGVTVYRWGTEIYKNLPISAGMDNGEAIVTEYPDILAQWKAQLFDASDTAVLNVATAEANALAAIETAGEAKKQSVLDSIPDEYEVLSALADQNHRNKAGSIVLDAEGESIVVNDASEYPLQNLKLFGKSTQDGTPTPDAPVDVVSVENPVVTVCRKNLIRYPYAFSTRTMNGVDFTDNGDGSITVDGTATGAISFHLASSFTLPAGKYVLSGCPSGGSLSTYRIYFSDNVTKTVADYGNTSVFTLDESFTGQIVLQVISGAVINNLTFYPMIRFASVEDEAFDTYKKQMLSIPHTLPGIPVSSGGNYTDANGQEWICDEVDLARCVYVQRTAEITIDGSATPSVFAVGNNGGSVFAYSYDELRMNIARTRAHKLCNRLQLPTTYNPVSFKDCGIGHWGFNTDGSNDMFIVMNVGEFDTANDVASWLAANPVTFVYQLATPIETALTDAEITAFRALCSNRPNTVILNDAGAHMAVSYVADTKTYIDNKIKELMEGVTE